MIYCQQHSSKITRQLKDNKLKVTATRLSLLDVFEHAKKPLSVKELREELSDKQTDKVTLYRTIETLKKLGLIKQIYLKDRRAYFEVNSDQHHHHLVCTDCHSIKDIAMDDHFEALERKILEKEQFKVLSHVLEFYGLCSKCQ